jgi:hypothetical protein
MSAGASDTALTEVRHEVVEKVAKSFRISSCFREVYTTF